MGGAQGQNFPQMHLAENEHLGQALAVQIPRVFSRQNRG
jgi:hypothetical protein